MIVCVGGWEDRREGRRSGYITKNKNATRQCGELKGYAMETAAVKMQLQTNSFTNSNSPNVRFKELDSYAMETAAVNMQQQHCM